MGSSVLAVRVEFVVSVSLLEGTQFVGNASFFCGYGVVPPSIGDTVPIEVGYIQLFGVAGVCGNLSDVAGEIMRFACAFTC
jgi:hypothetical protein